MRALVRVRRVGVCVIVSVVCGTARTLYYCFASEKSNVDITINIKKRSCCCWVGRSLFSHFPGKVTHSSTSTYDKPVSLTTAKQILHLFRTVLPEKCHLVLRLPAAKNLDLGSLSPRWHNSFN